MAIGKELWTMVAIILFKIYTKEKKLINSQNHLMVSEWWLSLYFGGDYSFQNVFYFFIYAYYITFILLSKIILLWQQPGLTKYFASKCLSRYSLWIIVYINHILWLSEMNWIFLFSFLTQVQKDIKMVKCHCYKVKLHFGDFFFFLIHLVCFAYLFTWQLHFCHA